MEDSNKKDFNLNLLTCSTNNIVRIPQKYLSDIKLIISNMKQEIEDKLLSELSIKEDNLNGN